MMTHKERLALSFPIGERRLTKAHRVIVKCGEDGGKVRFFFEDEGEQKFHQQMSARSWQQYSLAAPPDIQQKEGNMIKEILAMVEAGDLDEDLNVLLKA